MTILYANDRFEINIPDGCTKIKIVCHVGGLSLTVYMPQTGEQVYAVPAGNQAVIEVVPDMNASFISLGTSASYEVTTE